MFVIYYSIDKSRGQTEEIIYQLYLSKYYYLSFINLLVIIIYYYLLTSNRDLRMRRCCKL